jgi:hypothetical protein
MRFVLSGGETACYAWRLDALAANSSRCTGILLKEVMLNPEWL